MLAIDMLPEVAEAIAANRPVVALETTIITHGMPYPANVETALAVEAAIREAGAVPATMAIWKGKPRAGLTQAEIEELAQTKDVAKASRRDLAILAARGEHGATTVAGTMVLAHRAGIPVFVTGGIGGVHRGATHSMDVSADLTELARTPVAVVCAGVKSILNIGLTLEVLETYGVPVIGYGTDRFPAFYVPDSGYPAPWRADTPTEVAAILREQQVLGLGGCVIANPIPEAYALDDALIAATIEAALAEADRQGVTGKAITPFLLAEVNRRTGGESLAANVELVLNNARLGAAIAVAWAGQP